MSSFRPSVEVVAPQGLAAPWKGGEPDRGAFEQTRAKLRIPALVLTGAGCGLAATAWLSHAPILASIAVGLSSVALGVALLARA